MSTPPVKGQPGSLPADSQNVSQRLSSAADVLQQELANDSSLLPATTAGPSTNSSILSTSVLHLIGTKASLNKLQTLGCTASVPACAPTGRRGYPRSSRQSHQKRRWMIRNPRLLLQSGLARCFVKSSPKAQVGSASRPTSSRSSVPPRRINTPSTTRSTAPKTKAISSRPTAHLCRAARATFPPPLTAPVLRQAPHCIPCFTPVPADSERARSPTRLCMSRSMPTMCNRRDSLRSLWLQTRATRPHRRRPR